MSKRIVHLTIVLLIAVILLACNVDSFVQTSVPRQSPALQITLPPPTLTPIPTSSLMFIQPDDTGSEK